MAYEELSRLLKASSTSESGSMQDVQLTSLQISGVGAASKLFSSVITYPTQVVRTRLQQRSDASSTVYKGTLSTFRNIFVREGISGFYKGMVPNLMRTIPQSAITFLAYEKILASISSYG